MRISGLIPAITFIIISIILFIIDLFVLKDLKEKIRENPIPFYKELYDEQQRFKIFYIIMFLSGIVLLCVSLIPFK